MTIDEAIKYLNNPLSWAIGKTLEQQIADNKEATQMAIDALEKQRWIPVTERLPEDYVDVLVWFEYFRFGNYNRLYQTWGIGDYSEKYGSWTVNHESGWHKLRVIAWMPLPEPYRKE